MKAINRYLLGICILLAFTACNTSFDNQEDLDEYLSDTKHGYFYEKEINGVTYSLRYRPTDVLVKQEMGTATNKNKVEELREKYRSYIYFILRISKGGEEILSSQSNNKNSFGSMVNQLSFDLDQKINLYTTENDTIKMLDFVYPRMYGMSKSTSVMMVFPRDEKEMRGDFLNFVIQDIGLGTGNVKFKIDIQALNNEPGLNFD
jgi:hypothetical protein